MEAALKLLTRRQGNSTVAAAAPAPAPASAPAPAPAPYTFTVNASKISTVNTTVGTFITYLFYLSAAIFFIFLILVFVHFTITPIFKLSHFDKGIIGVSTTQDKDLQWSTIPPDSTMKTDIKNPKSCDYTISFDVFVPNGYQAITAPHVLLYRSDNEVIMSPSIKTSDLLSTFPTTNILAYIDSEKNDLNVYVVTTNDKGQYTQESVPTISNIPQGTPFRLSVAFMPNYVEVYVNGKLNATTILKGTPVKISSQFWPPPKSVSNAVKVGNLYYWPRALMASELQALVSTSADFFKKT